MKVLIVKTSSLGDILHCFPVVEYLKKYNEEIEIHWIVESSFSSLLKAHPEISKVIEINSHQWRKKWFNYQTLKELLCSFKQLRHETYDLVIDLQGNSKSGLITTCSKSKDKIGFGYKSVSEILNLLGTNRRYNPSQNQNIREDYLEIVKLHLSDTSDFISSKLLLNINNEEQAKIDEVLNSPKINRDNSVMVCPGAHWKNKQLKLQTLIEFMQKIHSYENHCSWLLVWGSESEKEFCLEISRNFPDHSIVVEKLALPLLQNLMSSMKKVIAMDSLPLHLAGIAAVPTFGVFGPSSAKKYGPTGPLNENFQGKCPYNKEFVKRCPILRTCQTGACIQEVTAETLFQVYVKSKVPFFSATV